MRPSSGGRWKVPKRGGSCGSWLQSKFEDRVSRTIERRQPRVHEAAGRMKSPRHTILRLTLDSPRQHCEDSANHIGRKKQTWPCESATRPDCLQRVFQKRYADRSDTLSHLIEAVVSDMLKYPHCPCLNSGVVSRKINSRSNLQPFPCPC